VPISREELFDNKFAIRSVSTGYYLALQEGYWKSNEQLDANFDLLKKNDYLTYAPILSNLNPL